MSIQYAGNPNNFPVDFTIPDSSDPPEAAFENVSKEALGDRTAFLKRIANGFAAEAIIDVNGTWTCPAGVTKVRIAGFGGGGGGGSGNGSGVVSSNNGGGGGGGGGARLGEVIVDVVPGTVYTVTVGAGGGPGAIATNGGDGDDGSDTTFAAPGPTVLARFKGGRGGVGGRVRASASQQQLAPGGRGPARSTAKVNPFVLTADDLQFCGAGEGEGGFGSTRNRQSTLTVAQLQAGGPSANGFAGGAGGADGVDDTTHLGGGGGGGGGAGPAGAGAAAGAGGDGTSTATGNPGGYGADASPNTGAGGGGGGAGGGGTTNFGTDGHGGQGGSGRLMIFGLLRDEA